MTDEEIRLIRRLVVGELPAAATASRPVDPRHEERFRRALSGPRRSAGGMGAEAGVGEGVGANLGGTVGRATMEGPARHSENPASLGAGRAAPGRLSATQHEPTHERADVVGASAVLPKPSRHHDDADADADSDRLSPPEATDTVASGPASAAAAQPPSLDPQPLPLPELRMPPVASAPALHELPNDWASGLADTVLTLCTGSDPSFHSWTIQVPIDSAALPHTELRMTFSRHHLQLRFSTQSTQSYALISAHQSQLHRLLSRDLPGDRHIDIELT